MYSHRPLHSLSHIRRISHNKVHLLGQRGVCVFDFFKEIIFQEDMLPIFPFPLLGDFKIQSNNSKRDEESRRETAQM